MKLAAALPSPLLAAAVLIAFALFVAGEVIYRRVGVRRLLHGAKTINARIDAAIWEQSSNGQSVLCKVQPRMRPQAKISISALTLIAAIAAIVALANAPVSY